MIKYIGIAVLVLLVAGSWFKFYQSGTEMRELTDKIAVIENEGDPEDEVPSLKKKFSSLEGERVFNGILLTFLTAGLVGIMVVTVVIPMLADKVTHAVYDSGEEVERDPFHDARVLMAQGEWEGAIEAFRAAAETDTYNRMPLVEIAKIQQTHLEDPAAAIETLREGIQAQEWAQNDAAFLMFRLSEIYDEGMEDRNSAAAILQQIMEQFPETRHSANARTKLHEWGMD